MDFVYFALIYRWLQDKISGFGAGLLHNVMQFATGIALALVTVWILVQGFRIVTGRSRDSMMALVADMGRIGVIVAAATVMAVDAEGIQRFFSHDLARDISKLVTGSDDPPVKAIDRNLAYTQLAMASIEAVSVPVEDVANANAQGRASLIAMLGVAGPPMTAGAMLLMFQVAMALFVGLGPLFILCLIFEQTKPMFQRWLMYGLSTLFSLAVLNVMVAIVLELTLRVARALWSAHIVTAITDASAEGFTNQALQQGGIGLLMTVLLISTPPMAAAFFGGMVGQFISYATVNGGSNINRQGPQGQVPGMWAAGQAPTTAGNRWAPPSGDYSRIADSSSLSAAPPLPDTVKTASEATVRETRGSI